MTRNQEILKLRAQDKTLQAIADIYGISRERVGQICRGDEYWDKLRAYQQIYQKTPARRARVKVLDYAGKEADERGVSKNKVLAEMGAPLVRGGS